MVSINPAPVTSVAATGQDAKFETRLNTMGNAIFKSSSACEKFISTNKSSGKSRGEIDRGYLTDFSVNVSQSEIGQSADDESNCGPSPQTDPAIMLSILIFAEHQRIYLIRTLICWFQMQKSRINQVRRIVQHMI